MSSSTETSETPSAFVARFAPSGERAARAVALGRPVGGPVGGRVGGPVGGLGAGAPSADGRGGHEGAGGAASDEIRVCTERALEHAPGSYALAQDENPSNIPHEVALLDAVEAVSRISKKWAPGRELHVLFLDGDAAIHANVERIAREWERYADIRFTFDQSPAAEIRITFANGGSWSYIGTDALGVPRKLATMQLGWLTPTTDLVEYRRIVLHEFGHAIGLHHEHQNPSGGVPWDKPKVYAYYREALDPSWDEATVDAKVIAPHERNRTNFTAFDPDSIMEYAIPEALTVGGFHVEANAELSQADRDLVAMTWYPHPHVDLGVAHSALVARTSQHLDLFWIAPDGSVLRSSFGGEGPWSAPRAIAGPGSAHIGAIAAVARESGHLDVFWVAPDGSVRSAWWHEGIDWSGPHAIAPAGSADPGAIAAVARQTDRVDVFWVSADGSVRTMPWHDGDGWAPTVEIAEPDAAELGAVHAIARASNLLDVFWVTQDHRLATATWHDGGTWSAAAPITGPAMVEPGAIGGVARKDDCMDVFWTTARGEIATASCPDGATWGTPTTIAPPNSSAYGAGIVATARQSNHLDLFWLSPDGAIMSAWWHERPGGPVRAENPGHDGTPDTTHERQVGEAWSTPFRLTGFGVAEGRSLSAVARLNGHLDLCWVASDGAVLSTWWHDGQPWARSFGIAGVGAAAS